jgi:putative nucleotidyltransferase with HDIG domain
MSTPTKRSPFEESGMGEQILVVERETVVRNTVVRILARAGFRVHAAEDAADALGQLAGLGELAVVVAHSLEVEAIRHARAAHPRVRSILIATDAEPASGRLAHDVGVDHTLVMPLDMDHLLATVQSLSSALKRDRERLALLERLRKNVVGMVDSLAQALEARDPYTAGHSLRVADYSLMIGEELGLSDLELEVLRHGAALHDIGKIAVKQEVLHKPGRLTDEEFEHIKIHPVVGKEILEPIEDFQEMLDLVYYHHERIDGRGYPEGLKGADIPVLAQIVAVADTYDAMTSDRPYRAGMHPERALAIMKEVSGTQLNGDLVAILSRRVRALMTEAASA